MSARNPQTAEEIFAALASGETLQDSLLVELYADTYPTIAGTTLSQATKNQQVEDVLNAIKGAVETKLGVLLLNVK